MERNVQVFGSPAAAEALGSPEVMGPVERYSDSREQMDNIYAQMDPSRGIDHSKLEATQRANQHAIERRRRALEQAAAQRRLEQLRKLQQFAIDVVYQDTGRHKFRFTLEEYQKMEFTD